MVDDYASIFINIKLRDYLNKRKSSTARATIKNMVEFFFNSQKLTSDQNLLIQKELKTDKKEHTEEMDFLTKRMLLSSSVILLSIDLLTEIKKLKLLRLWFGY